MNVDKLKKMNVLADTLKQHGLAATREDAASMAGDMVGTVDETQFSKVFVEPDQKISIHRDESQETLETEQAAERKVFDEEQVKNILQSFADQFSSEINRMTEKLSSQDEMIKELREMLEAKKVAEPAARSRDEESHVQVHVAEEKPAEPMRAPQESVQRQAPSSPRSGGFSSEDVAIDKFFYYGTK